MTINNTQFSVPNAMSPATSSRPSVLAYIGASLQSAVLPYTVRCSEEILAPDFMHVGSVRENRSFRLGRLFGPANAWRLRTLNTRAE